MTGSRPPLLRRLRWLSNKARAADGGLLTLTREDEWTLDDACEHLALLGYADDYDAGGLSGDLKDRPAATLYFTTETERDAAVTLLQATDPAVRAFNLPGAIR